MSEQKQESIALVTGASGFVASELIAHLLESGIYTTVRGTVRSSDPNNEKIQHLLQQFPKLQLVEADLLSSNGWDNAVKGCTVVFHTASPFQTKVDNPIRDLIEPAVSGVEHVVSAAIRAHVPRIVLTSSVAAVRRNDKPEDYVYSDKDWNETATLESAPYPRSKYLAERKAWELIEAQTGDHKTHLVVICPTLVLGPPRTKRVDGVSMSLVVEMLNGKRSAGVPPSALGIVDIRNVAQAHIKAATVEKAHGRYILSSPCSYSFLDVAQIFEKLYPERASILPKSYLSDSKIARPFMDNSRAAKKLGIQWIPLETSLKDMGDALIKLGLVN